MPVENHIHAMVLEKLGDRPHLVVPHGRIPGRKRGLVKHHKFPGLPAGVEITNQPIAKHRGIRGKRELRSRVHRWPIENPIKQMWVGIQENEMRAAVVKRVVALVIYLLLRSLARIDQRGRLVSRNRRRRTVIVALEAEEHPVRRHRIAVVSKLRINRGRTIQRKVIIIEVGQRIPTINVAAEPARDVAPQHVGTYSVPANVVIPHNDVKRNRPDKRSARLVRIDITVPHRKPIIAIAALRAIVIHIVASVQRQIGFWQLRSSRHRKILHVVHQVDDARFVIRNPRRIRAGHHGKKSLIPLHDERKIVSALARSK